MHSLFEHAWARFIVASLLLAAYGGVELISKLTAWRHRPRARWRPLWSHLLGFVSLMAFYGLIGSDGHSWLGGTLNRIGVLLSALAMVLRFLGRRGAGPVRHPDLAARVFFFAALPLVVGSPKSWLWFTLPQALIAANEARRRRARA